MMLCKKHLAATLAILGGLWYIVCHLWGLMLPADVIQFHADFLRISVLGWTGMNITSFLLGVIQWSIWGALFGLSFATVGKWCAKTCSYVQKK